MSESDQYAKDCASRAENDPSEFVLDLVRRKGQARLSLTPDYMGSIAKIRQSPNRFKTPEEVDTYLAALRAEW